MLPCCRNVLLISITFCWSVGAPEQIGLAIAVEVRAVLQRPKGAWVGLGGAVAEVGVIPRHNGPVMVLSHDIVVAVAVEIGDFLKRR
jgi:hypothetical protein